MGCAAAALSAVCGAKALAPAAEPEAAESEAAEPEAAEPEAVLTLAEIGADLLVARPSPARARLGADPAAVMKDPATGPPSVD